MKIFAAMAVAVASLLPAALPAQAQTVPQYQNQLSAAVCLNNWTEALSMTQMLIGSEQITPQYRQQLVNYRVQLEDYRARGIRFDHSSEANCAAAIAAAPQEAARLQAPSQPLNWERAAASIPQGRPAIASAPVRSVALAPVAASGGDAEFWDTFNYLVSSRPEAAAFIRGVDPSSISSLAQTLCGSLRSGESMDSIMRMEAERELPPQFAGALNVSAVHGYCPQYEYMLN